MVVGKSILPTHKPLIINNPWPQQLIHKHSLKVNTNVDSTPLHISGKAATLHQKHLPVLFQSIFYVAKQVFRIQSIFIPHKTTQQNQLNALLERYGVKDFRKHYGVPKAEGRYDDGRYFDLYNICVWGSW